MDLWIRSQDKKQLTNTNNLEVEFNKYEESSEKWQIISRLGIDHYNSIGVYQTKERALEVLDEIQNKINLINLGHDFGSPMVDLKNPTYIYQMPKE